VNKNHDADEVVRNVQQQNIRAHNNIADLGETIISQNGLNLLVNSLSNIYHVI